MAKRLLILTLYILRRGVHHLLATGASTTAFASFSLSPPLNFLDLLPARRGLLCRLGRVRRRELALRAGLALLHNWEIVSSLTLAHAAVAVFFVGVVRLDGPEAVGAALFFRRRARRRRPARLLGKLLAPTHVPDVRGLGALGGRPAGDRRAGVCAVGGDARRRARDAGVLVRVVGEVPLRGHRYLIWSGPWVSPR